MFLVFVSQCAPYMKLTPKDRTAVSLDWNLEIRIVHVGEDLLLAQVKHGCNARGYLPLLFLTEPLHGCLIELIDLVPRLGPSLYQGVLDWHMVVLEDSREACFSLWIRNYDRASAFVHCSLNPNLATLPTKTMGFWSS